MLCFVLMLCILGVRGDTTTTSASTTTLKNLTTPAASSTPVTKAQIPSTNNTTSVKIVSPLVQVTNYVSSGNIVITENKTVNIHNFFFDGNVPNTHFLVGKGNVSEDGTIIYVTENSTTPLSAYDGENIAFTLPNNLTIDDIEWLAVWSLDHNKPLGYVNLQDKPSPYPPQTSGLKSEVTSDPVVLINKKTLFIPNFHYKGDHSNVRFWVGNRNKVNSSGRPIPDEIGNYKDLQSYNGRNFFLDLPIGVDTDNIEYFGVWSIDEDKSLGFVPINNISGVPEYVKAVFTIKVPKCCPFNAVVVQGGCDQDSSISFKPALDVYKHNNTHFWNHSLDLNIINFDPFEPSPTRSPNCPSGRIMLQKEDNYALLKNGSLLVKGPVLCGILPPTEFCVDNVFDNETTMGVFVCAPPEPPIQQAMFVTYVTFTIISTMCFTITFIVYFFLLKIENIHRRCFTGYVFSMTMTFVSLTIVQTAKVESAGCEVLGFFFQLFMIASFTLLAILCFDILLIIKFIDEDMLQKQRKYWYLGVSLGVPLLSLIISLFRNLTPDVPNSFFKPQYQKNYCYFNSDNQRTIYFYFPIGLAIFVSFVCLSLAKYKCVLNDRQVNYFWIEKGQFYKFMWRKYLIVFLMSFMWCIGTLAQTYANSGLLIAIDILEACQGVIVLLLFVVNEKTRTQLIKTIKKARQKKRKINFNSIITEEELMMN